MPSRKHESHLLLFQNQPRLAARLMRDTMGAELPSYAEARVASAALSDIRVTEYRADLVVELWNRTRPVYGIVVLGPSAVPIVSDEALALENPELAVLSAMAHGRSADTQRIAR